jgi:tetratricopeptide (TPR) repeat protein
LAQDQAATAELDELLTLYRQRGEHQRAISILRELVDLRPQAVEFHRRLAEAYQAAGAVPDAVQEWDMVSRILWNDGEMEEAKRVIREIIGLNPENVQTYRARLQQMGG